MLQQFPRFFDLALTNAELDINSAQQRQASSPCQDLACSFSQSGVLEQTGTHSKLLWGGQRPKRNLFGALLTEPPADSIKPCNQTTLLIATVSGPHLIEQHCGLARRNVCQLPCLFFVQMLLANFTVLVQPLARTRDTNHTTHQVRPGLSFCLGTSDRCACEVEVMQGFRPSSLSEFVLTSSIVHRLRPG